MINRIVRDNNHDNIYIMKSYKKNDDGTYNDEIDTIYEIYISLHFTVIKEVMNEMLKMY